MKMEMGKRRILLVSWLMMAACVVAGCSDAAFAQFEYTVAGKDADAIEIDVRDRMIDVMPSDDDMIHIIYSASGKEDYSIGIDESKVLSMTSDYNKDWSDFIGLKPAAEYRRISLEIPEKMLDHIYLSTTNEDISIHGRAAADDILIDVNGGSIGFDELDVSGTLSFSAKNGDIKGNVRGGYDDFSIRTDIKKGECNLPDKDGGSKLLDIICNNGDVEISLIK